MDELLQELSRIAALLLPILGVVVLVFLVLLLKRGLDMMKQLSGTVTKVDSAIVTVSDRINDLKGPLHTLNKLSGSIELVQDATENAIKSLFVTVASNFDVIKDWVLSFINKRKDKKQGNIDPLEGEEIA